MSFGPRWRPRPAASPDEHSDEQSDGGGGSTGADPDPDPESAARAIILRQLASAPRSRHQLEDALSRRGVDEALAARLLDRFTEVGLIDDAEYAQMLVRSQHQGRSLARRGLAQELRRKGIADEHAAAALEQVDDEAEERAARDLLRRRWRSGPDVDPQAQARRAMAMLGRKGYSSGLSSRLVREMVDDRGGDLGDEAQVD